MMRVIQLAVACVAMLLFISDGVISATMGHGSFVSGWTLFLMILGLAAYQLRKRLPILPLGNVANWLQVHIYAGLLTGCLFVIHVGYRVPDGTLESILALLYLLVFFSGVGGLILSRTIPPRLASRGEEVLFERIPVFIRKLRDEVETLVFDAIEVTDTTAIPELYQQHLQAFFERPRHALLHLLHSKHPVGLLLNEVHATERFVNEQELVILEQIVERAQAKDDLDYQFALQGVLKLWLFVHVPLTYSLIVIAVCHLVAASAFVSSIG
jgi:cytochrome b561